MQGISWLAVNRLASQAGLCCMELVSKHVTRALASCWYGSEEAIWWNQEHCTFITYCFYQLQKCPQSLKLWLYCQSSKCFGKMYNTAWPFPCEPSSMTAAAYSSASKLPGHFCIHIFTYSSHRQLQSCRCCCSTAGSCKAISYVTVYKITCKTGGHSGPLQLLW
jgi:hypothetical protein